MRLNGRLALEKLEDQISTSVYFQLLQKIKLHHPIIGYAHWKVGQTSFPIPIHTQVLSTSEIPGEILNRKIELHHQNLCTFDLLYTPAGKTILLFSWHHLLLDGFGANKLLESLTQHTADEQYFLPVEPKEGIIAQWNQLVEAKDFLKEISREPLVKIRPLKSKAESQFLEIELNEEDREKMGKAASALGCGLSPTPFYLACMARACLPVFDQNNFADGDLWVPVPMETRKRGALGPVLTNQHTFLFFRIKRALIREKAALIKDLKEQLFGQVKIAMPRKYAAMSRLLRLLPTWFYYQLIKGPNGDSIAGFLFSQSPAPDNLKPFIDLDLEDATALPPNTTPPGISFQLMTFAGRLKLILQYNTACFSTSQARNIFDNLKKELLADGR